VVGQWQQIKDCYNGDFYPLKPWTRDASSWIAWQYDCPETGEGVVQAFRRNFCTESTIALKLRDLAPRSHYTVRNLADGSETTATGRLLMEKGLTVSLAERPAAAVFRYKRVR
jgi:alpha-galactosidase